MTSTDWKQGAAVLRQLRELAGDPSYDEIVATCERRGDLLGKGTISSLLTGLRQARSRSVRRFMQACLDLDGKRHPPQLHGEQRTIEHWIKCYDDAVGSPRTEHVLDVSQSGIAPVEVLPVQADASPPRSAYALGRPLVEVRADPKTALDYEVHPAIVPFEAKSLSALPAYVRRPHDEQLAAVIDRAQAGSTVAAVLVGESSTGKTRACWEALSRLSNPTQRSDASNSAGWRLWHPLTVQDLLDGLAGAGDGAMLAGRTVIWLNELQRYLLSTSEEADRAAAELRVLLRDRAPTSGPVLVLGTIWQDPYWATLISAHTGSGPDPFEQARQLTHQITTIVVPPELTVEARQIAKSAAIDDSRWEVALREAPERPVQYLAGAEYLRRRYEHATATRRAVLQAAGDARRIGVPAQLPLDFLQAAARDYLPDQAWDLLPAQKKHQAVWVREAIEGEPDTPGNVSLAHGGLGVRGPLHAVRPGNGATHASEFELADYLDQHLRQERVTTQPRDSLWEAVARLADPELIRLIGYEARARGRFRPAAYLFKAAATAGYIYAWNDLGLIRQEARDSDGAAEAYYQAIAAGYPAWQGLASALERAGDREGAERAAEQGKALGSPRAWAELAWLRAESGDSDGANRARSQGLTTGSDGEWCDWKQARKFLRQDERRRSEKRPEDPAVHPDVSSVDTTMMEMARLREQQGDREGADAAAQQAASVGNTKVWESLAWSREESGDLDGAATAYQQAGTSGNYNAWMQVARLQELCGDQMGADRIRRFGVTADGLPETTLQ